MNEILPSLLGLGGICLAGVSLVPYLVSTMRGRTRPHIFTWTIWLALTIAAFAVQFSGGAGPGAWATGATALGCLLIMLASFKNGERNITRSDWLTFLAAVAAVPIWLLTKSPALAAVWITIIDALGYYPTCRKSWHKPHEEFVFTHLIANVKHVFSLLAIRHYNVATTLYPAALMVLNVVLVALIYWRRYELKDAAPL